MNKHLVNFVWHQWRSDSISLCHGNNFPLVPINCFIGCTVRLLLCALPLIYSPVSTPTAVGLWNVTKNCNEHPLSHGPPVCKLCGITTWLLEGLRARPSTDRATSRLVSSQWFFVMIFVILYSGCGINWARRVRFDVATCFLSNVLDALSLLFSTQMLRIETILGITGLRFTPLF